MLRKRLKDAASWNDLCVAVVKWSEENSPRQEYILGSSFRRGGAMERYLRRLGPGAAPELLGAGPSAMSADRAFDVIQGIELDATTAASAKGDASGEGLEKIAAVFKRPPDTTGTELQQRERQYLTSAAKTVQGSPVALKTLKEMMELAREGKHDLLAEMVVAEHKKSEAGSVGIIRLTVTGDEVSKALDGQTDGVVLEAVQHVCAWSTVAAIVQCDSRCRQVPERAGYA